MKSKNYNFYGLMITAIMVIITMNVRADHLIANGNISTNTTWGVVDSVLVTGDVTIDDGTTLTIDPGMIVSFQDAYRIFVNGRILAVGTETDSIKFTIPDTTGYAANTFTGWRGIAFNHTPTTNDSSKICYCILEYIKTYNNNGSGYNYWDGAIGCYYTDKLLVSNNEIRFSSMEPFLGGQFVNVGSAITIARSDIKISRNYIHHNRGFERGILYFYRGNVSFNDNVVCNNYLTASGGGSSYFYFGGTMSADLVDTMIFSGNTINNNYSENCGGGIHIYRAKNVSILYNRIQSNTSNQNGAGISLQIQKYYVPNIRIINNLVTGNMISDESAIIYRSGGGIAIWNFQEDTIPGSYQIINNTITGNSAEYGGGIYIHCNLQGDQMIYNNIFHSDSSEIAGDEIYLDSTCITTGMAVEYNFIPEGVNGIVLESGGVFNGTYYKLLDFDPGFTGAGQEPYALTQTSFCINYGRPDTTGLNLPLTDIIGNPRINGCLDLVDLGAYEFPGPSGLFPLSDIVDTDLQINCDTLHVLNNVSIQVAATLTIEPGVVVLFEGGAGFSVTGGLHAAGTPVDSIRFTISDTTGFYNNTHAGWAGIKFDHSSEQNLFSYCIVEYIKNEASPNGGVNFIYSESNISHSTFRNNRTSSGTVRYEHSGITFTDNNVLYNHASARGGGLYAWLNYYRHAIIKNNEFGYNSANIEGGAIYLKDNSYHCIISDNYIHDNTADQSGGGITYYSGWSGNVSIIDNLIVNNMVGASGNKGGGGLALDLMFSSINLVVSNNTISGNSSQLRGGAVYLHSISNMKFTNNLIYSNDADMDGDELYLEDLTNCTISNCNVQNSYSEIYYANDPYAFFDNLISTDPKFVGTGDHPYALQAISPCVDAGTPDTTGLFLPDVDYAGNPRIYAGYIPRVDIGAYEYQGDRATTRSALEFDGNFDYVSLDTLWGVSPNEFSVEAWIYPLSGDDEVIFYHGDNGEFQMGISGNAMRMSVKLAGEGWYEAVMPALPLNQWSHACGTWKRNDAVKLYVDGVLKASTPVPNAPLQDPGPAFQAKMGSYNNNGAWYNGKIDEVRIWNEALDVNRIRENLHLTLTGTEDNLYAYWPVNEFDGIHLTDLAGGNIGHFGGNCTYVESSAPLGMGASYLREVSATGPQPFYEADLDLYILEKTGTDTLVATKILYEPNILPEVTDSLFRSQYWILDHYGLGSFAAGLIIKPYEDLTQQDQENPGQIRLYTRAPICDTSWGFFDHATALNAITDEVGFDTITSGGQYIIGRAASTALDLKAFLEGPFNGSEMNTTLNSGGHLPLSQPYNQAPWYYSGTEAVTAIPNTDVVDWVLIELRDA
ncbi:MAG: right-handed parallel beta-helix repeat-containing protein, partial [Bacteroidales bacterium]|nr:right-handed parallel beta-helix repeat-containing protein [Bacteroidales bacterium]